MTEYLVVGAGIGGLACALLLHRSGRPVTVLERAAEVGETGTALSMWPAALRALDVLGLGERVREIGVPPSGVELRGAGGRRLLRLPAGAEGRRGEEAVLIAREDLIRLLHSALPAGVVRTATPVRDPAALLGPDTVLIGADGLRSVVRDRLLPGRSTVRYAGVTVWRGVFPGETPTSMEILGADRKFGLTRLDGGRTNFYAAIWAPESAPPARGGLDRLRAEFAGWAQPVPWALERLREQDLLRHDIHYVDPPLRTFVSGRVAVLGDAAHGMPPDLGQGACQALRDGVTLAACLCAGDAERDPEAALRRYDRLRRRPAQRIARAARRTELLTTGPVLRGLRSVLSRPVPGPTVGQADWATRVH